MKSTRKFLMSRRLLAIAGKRRRYVGVDFGFNDDMFVMRTRDGLFDLRHGVWLTQEVSVQKLREMYPMIADLDTCGNQGVDFTHRFL